jgi:hypothetical protein
MSLRHRSGRRLEKILEVELEGVGVGGGGIEEGSCVIILTHD